MRPEIHPTYYPQARVTCSCGTTWLTGSTVEEIRTDVCNTCHPFYTGEQRIVDSAGQVERFMRRVEQAEAAPRRKKVERRQRKIDQRQRLRRQEQELVVGDDETPSETDE